MFLQLQRGLQLTLEDKQQFASGHIHPICKSESPGNQGGPGFGTVAEYLQDRNHWVTVPIQQA